MLLLWCSCADDGVLGPPIEGDLQTLSVPGCFAASLPATMRRMPIGLGDTTTAGEWGSPDLFLAYDCGPRAPACGPDVQPVTVEGIEGIYCESVRIDDGTTTHERVELVFGLRRRDHERRVYVGVSLIDPAQYGVARSVLASVRDLYK